MTRERIMRALEQTGGNRSRAAELLGVGRATLYRWLDREGIAPRILRQIGQRYTVVRLLGEGSQSTVYLVRDRTGRLPESALKLVNTHGARGRLAALENDALQQEFRTLSMLRHPGLVRVHDYGIDEATARPFLVMERVRGEPFTTAARGRSPRWIGRALVQVLQAVEHLHRHGLVHRDLKAENVYVTIDDETNAPPRVTVMDLGLSEDLSGPALRPGGTAAYAAPEILAGGRASSRSDLYAIGVMAFVALTGAWPARRESAVAPVEAAGAFRPVPSALREEIPPELVRIVARLLEADPARRYPDAGAVLEDLAGWLGRSELAERVARGPDAELVGRSEEIATVVRTLGASPERRADAPRALVIVGEPGIGKSRFLGACLDEFKTRGWRVAQGTCRSGGEGGLGPVAEIVAGALAGADGTGDSPEDRLAKRHCPLLGPLIGVGRDRADGAASPAPSRFQTLDRLAALFEDLSQLRPLVIGVDDLHLGEPLVLDLIWLLARRAKRAPLALLASTRASSDARQPVASLLQGATTEGLLQLMPLGPLDQESTRRMTEDVLGVAQAALFNDRLWELTAGHPLFIHELLQEIAEDTSGSSPKAPIELPATAREAMLARLHRVEPGGRELLGALAVAGRPEFAERLVAVCGSPPDAASAIGDLARRQIICQSSDGTVDFTSGPLRDVVLSSINDDRRREWHRRWAALLTDHDGESIARSEHLLAAGAGAEVRDALLAAAERLVRSWNHQAAIRFYEAGLQRHDPDDPLRLKIFPKLELACREAHRRERAADVCTEWAELARRLGDLVSQARALGYLAANLRELREWDRALSAANEAVALAERSGDGRELSLASKSLALILWVSWRKREALEPLQRALMLARTSRDARGQAYTLQDVGLLQAVIGKTRAGLQAVEDSRQLFRESGDMVWPILAGSNEALILAYLGDTTASIELLHSTIAELRSIGASVPLEAPLENLAFLLNRVGRYTEALEIGQQLIDEATRCGRRGHRISGLLALGDAMFHLDEREKAKDYHRLAHSQALLLGEDRQRLFADIARSRDARIAGRLDAAEELARQVLEQSERETAMRQRIHAGLELARIALERSEPEAAQRCLDDAESTAQLPCEDGPALRASVLLERARAWIQLERLDLAQPAADEGLALALHHGPVECEIRLRSVLAKIHDERGDAGQAARAYVAAASRIDDVAARLTEPLHRARFLARPDIAALVDAGRRRAGEIEGGDGDRRLDALTSLYEVSRQIVTGGKLEPLFETIVKLAVERSGAERGLLLLSQPDGTLARAAAIGIEEATERDAARISQSALTAAGQSGALLLTDVSQDPEFGAAPSVIAFGIRSVMCAPLRVGEELLGTLYVDTLAADALFSEADLQFLCALADQAAIALAYGDLVGRVSRERDELRRGPLGTDRFGDLIGRSRAMREVFSLIEKVAASDLPVLIQGESGTGKELVARALHGRSGRPPALFFSENCAALPESLLESTLFGHVRGAFTGADKDKPGLFALADGGTLFLDEIGDMSEALQAKLLRVLQEKEFRPVGGVETLRTNVRIVAATHRDLPELTQSGAFRGDLYYRLTGLTITLPPLRDRREDIPWLARHFVELAATSAGRPAPHVSQSVMRVLTTHEWPGNVRELENAIRRLLLFTDGDRIDIDQLRADPDLGALVAPRRGAGERDDRDAGLSDEARRILEALRLTDGDKAAAAIRLGISRATLYRRIRTHGLDRRR